MKELTLAFEYIYDIDEDFYLYMLNLNGIKEVNVDAKTLAINIKYDEKTIDLNRIKLEILLFLGINNIPSLISFDKHGKKMTEYFITIKNLCCEYCLRSMIEDLLLVDGIDKVECKCDDIDKRNVIIDIRYDKKIINTKKLEEIESNLNYY